MTAHDAFLRLAFTAATAGIAWLAYVSGWPVLWFAAGMYVVGAVVAWADRRRA